MRFWLVVFAGALVVACIASAVVVAVSERRDLSEPRPFSTR